MAKRNRKNRRGPTKRAASWLKTRLEPLSRVRISPARFYGAYKRLRRLLPAQPLYLMQAFPMLAALGAAMWVSAVAWNNPSLRNRYEQVGALALSEGNYETARVCYRRLVADDVASQRYRYGLAVTLQNLDQRAHAAALLRSLAPDDDSGYAAAHALVAQNILRAAAPGDTDAMQRAEAHLLRCLRDEPDNADAHLLMGRICMATERPERAEQHWRRAASGSPVAALELASLLNGRGQRDAALPFARSAAEALGRRVAAHPNQRDARLQYADALNLIGDRGRAEQVLHDGVVLQPAGPFKSALALLQYQRATTEGLGQAIAARWLRQAIEVLKTKKNLTTDDHFVLGNAYRALGQPAEAVPHLATVAEQRPEIRSELARVYRAAGDEEGARRVAQAAADDYEARLAQDTTTLKWRLLAADASSALGDHEHAVAMLESEWKKSPAPLLANALARTYTNWWDDVIKTAQTAEQRRGRLTLLRSALTYSPWDAVAIERLLELRRTSKDLGPDVAALLNEMLARGEATAAAHFMIGTDAILRGSDEEARLHLRAARDLEPRSALIANNLAWAEMRASPPDMTRALKAIDDALKMDPGNPRYRETRGQVLVTMERWENAIPDLEAALVAMRGQPQLHKALAEAYRHVGQDALAAQHQKLAETAPPGSQNENAN
ncbi:MAG: hypothetical protein GC159_00360 [Phycisphaera sp.]|nr:hypothetical protein [Phycisphaera sp.]